MQDFSQIPTHINKPAHAFTATMNQWGEEKIPFLFVIDFEFEKPLIMRLDELDPAMLLYDVNGIANSRVKTSKSQPLIFEKFPIPLQQYEGKFRKVSDWLAYGNSYLTNLTVKTEIKFNKTLRELYFLSKSRYKLWMNDQFLVFSPETFVQIRGKKIFSYPMKGTIDARIPNAKELILQDKKELAEHVTIVDLIRNDLSRVASNVAVTRFRYVDEIKTNGKSLLQTSSEIAGDLPEKYLLGDLISSLLPAGSVSGAPKDKTVEIIRQAESEKRGYYTGVFGYFDGTMLDSGVMIRFIEQDGGKFFYRSGGGITAQSVVDSEYQEMIDKVYVPID